MKLTVWAKEAGLSYMTAWRLAKEGKFPAKNQQLETGTWIVHPDENPTSRQACRPQQRAD